MGQQVQGHEWDGDFPFLALGLQEILKRIKNKEPPFFGEKTNSGPF